MKLIGINDPSGTRIYINPMQITLMRRVVLPDHAPALEINLGVQSVTAPGVDLEEFAAAVNRELNDTAGGR